MSLVTNLTTAFETIGTKLGEVRKLVNDTGSTNFTSQYETSYETEYPYLLSGGLWSDTGYFKDYENWVD